MPRRMREPEKVSAQYILSGHMSASDTFIFVKIENKVCVKLNLGMQVPKALVTSQNSGDNGKCIATCRAGSENIRR